MAQQSVDRFSPKPTGGGEQGLYRVWITALRHARFESLSDAESFAGQLFHDRDHVVILEKLAPNGCWLQLDQLM